MRVCVRAWDAYRLDRYQWEIHVCRMPMKGGVRVDGSTPTTFPARNEEFNTMLKLGARIEADSRRPVYRTSILWCFARRRIVSCQLRQQRVVSKGERETRDEPKVVTHLSMSRTLNPFLPASDSSCCREKLTARCKSWCPR